MLLWLLLLPVVDELERRARETAALLLLLLFLALVFLVRTDWDSILGWLCAFNSRCLAADLPTTKDDEHEAAAEAARTIAGRQQEFIFYVCVFFQERYGWH